LQTLGLPAPLPHAGETLGAFAPSEIGFPGGTLQLGSKAGAGFVFDNERQSHAFHVAPFRMDSGLVTNAQYADFVTDGGYDNRQFWSDAAPTG
jgi:formylglycine-generating enzyme required for sulfatase activity